MKNNIVAVVFKKEIKDMFRDKKTLIISILIPLIIFPVMFGIMGLVMNKQNKEATTNVKIAMIGNKDSSIGKFISSQKEIKITDSKDVEKDVKDGKLAAAVNIPDDFEAKISKDNISNLTIVYDNTSQNSSMAYNMLKSYVETYSKAIVTERLKSKNIDTSILTPIQVQEKNASKENIGEKEAMGRMLVSMLLPLMLAIYCVAGPVTAATDLGAGEKERGTLEPLLTTQAGRMALLSGKFLAITVMGLSTVIASLAGLMISVNQKNSMFRLDGANAFNIPMKALIGIAFVAVLTTMMFGALELSISIYAKSFKEAQTYLSPLTIVGMIPAYAVYMLDAKNIPIAYFHIPIVNSTALMKEFISGIYNTNHIIITFAWVIVYVIASALFARYMFSKEEVIFRT